MRGALEAPQAPLAFSSEKARARIYVGAHEKKRGMAGTLALEDFQAYAQTKAYDVISAGHFKRHLGTCRENGDRWAVVMYNRQNKVAGKIREVFALVNQLSTPRSQPIQRVCKDVMSCAQPPIKVVTGKPP